MVLKSPCDPVRGRNIFQILKKRGIATEAEFNYGTNEHLSAEVYQSAQGRRLSGFSRIHTIDGAKHVLVENGPVASIQQQPCLLEE